jgi:putative ABC transport system permease protein
MNLSTARSSGRAKEVGVRKVLGSQRGQLIKQFLTESILISFVSLLLALLFALLLLPYFNQLAGKEMSIGLNSKPWLLPALIALVLLVGLLAGSYPAFFLSAFKPIEVLKGKFASGFKNSWLRSSLVVFQFWISIVLLVSTGVIYRQLNYIRSKELGFKREQVLVMQNTDALGSQSKAFKEEVLKIPGISNITMTGYLPTSNWRSDSPLFPDAVPDQKKALSAQIWNVDENYIPTLSMQILQGRNFSTQFPTDSSGIILNEAAVNLLGFKDPINKPLYYMNGFSGKKDLVPYHIIGVLKNFNFNSLREQVTPLALLLKNQPGGIAMRIDAKNSSNLVQQIESKWKAMAPGQPFSFSFMDDDFNRLYDSEQRTGKIFISFAVLAIFIACLGLYGLVTYAAEQRTKEIGIRKVLGASVGNIVGMLSKDFLKLIAISAVVAFPLAGWMMSKWLQDFAYRINMGWIIFIAAGAVTLFIAFATICFQVIKAALMNPVKSLRTE